MTSTPTTPATLTRTQPRSPQFRCSRQRPARRVAPALVAILTITALGSTACARVIDGTPVPAGDTASRGAPTAGPDTEPGADSGVDPADPTWDDDYRPPIDGRGYSAQPLDQPPPVPPMSWPGWADQPERHCSWLTPELAQRLGAIDTVKTHDKGCTLPIGPPEHAQITFGSAYSVYAGPAQFINVADVAGLPGRELAQPSQGRTECVAQVSTRSTLTLHVVVWDPASRDTGDRNRRCRLAGEIADTIVRALVPAAGGTPHPGTQTMPATTALEGKDACQIVPQTIADTANLGQLRRQAGMSPHGSTCAYAGEHGSMTATITGTSIAELPTILDDVAADDTTPGLLIGLPARYAPDGPRCGLAVQLTDDTALHLTYEVTAIQPPPGWACKAAEAVAADTIGTLLAAG